MSDKQIHELTPIAGATPEDEIVVSSNVDHVTGRLAIADLPFQAPANDSIARRLGAKVSESVSVRDFGAVGDGVSDDASAFQNALDSVPTIFVPRGRYRLGSQVIVRPGRRIEGNGRDSTEIIADGRFAFVFERNRGAFQVDAGSADDWNRSSIANMTVMMSRGGIRAVGHEFRASDMCFFGGTAPNGQNELDGWCIDMVDANECVLARINAGYGGGLRHTMGANGIRWRATTSGVNYGDSLIEEVSIKLASQNTAAFLIDGHAADNSKVINNMMLCRIQANAPVGGGGITPLSGTNGIKLWNAARIQMFDCDVEVVETAFEEYSNVMSGSGSCVANTYVGCISHYCPTSYKDSNAETSRSVYQRNFIGCDNVGPIRTGNYSGDGGRSQDGDAFVNGMWLMSLFSEPAVQLRSRDKGVLLVTSDYQGPNQIDADGHPSREKPIRGLLVELSSKNSTKITRTVSNSDPDPDTADDTRLLDTRLELGNGENDSRGELARVQINDPLYLRPRTSEPIRPINGLIYYATHASALPPTGNYWLGEGIYSRLADGIIAPVAAQPGAVPIRERNLDFTVGKADLGKIHRVNNSNPRTVRVEPGLVEPGTGARRLWVIRQGTGAVHFQVGNDVTLHATSNRTWIAKQFQMVEMIITDNDQVFLNFVKPDADDSFESSIHWTAGNVTAGSHYLGKIVRVSNNTTAYVEIPTGLVPDGVDAVWLKVMKVSAGDVEIRAGAGMILSPPRGSLPYVVSEIGKIVTVHVTSSTAAQQPNQIYIEE